MGQRKRGASSSSTDADVWGTDCYFLCPVEGQRDCGRGMTTLFLALVGQDKATTLRATALHSRQPPHSFHRTVELCPNHDDRFHLVRSGYV